MNGDIKITAVKLRKRKKRFRVALLLLVILILVIAMVYAAVSFIYNGYYFSITLDKNLYLKNNVVIYDDPSYKVYRSVIQAKSIDFFDNISEKWLPEDLDQSNGGSHNGDSYLAYTFFIENMGNDSVDYYDELLIDDVVKNVDEAIRFRVYFDGEPVVYAKRGIDGNPEEGTVPFKDNKSVFMHKVENFAPGQKHKYTIVMWLEGNDLECTNNILGGELKVHYDFKSYHK